MRDAEQMRSAVDLHVVGVGQCGMQTAALPVEGQDAVGGAVQDEGRDVDASDVLAEVGQPPGGRGPRGIRGGFRAGLPGRSDGLFAHALPEVVVKVHQVAEQAREPREAILRDRLLDAADAGCVDSFRVLVRLREGGCQGLDEDAALQPVGAIGADVAGDLAGAVREAHEADVVQIEFRHHGIHVSGE